MYLIRPPFNSSPACRRALYLRAKETTGQLRTSWLDAYYRYKPDTPDAAAGAPGSTPAAVLAPPFQVEISSFQFTDCMPLPPCSCLSLTAGSANDAYYIKVRSWSSFHALFLLIAGCHLQFARLNSFFLCFVRPQSLECQI